MIDNMIISSGWYTLLYLALIIIIHELGHYLGYVIYNKIPTLSVHWWGMSCGTKDQGNDLTIKQKMVVIWFGIIAGYVAILAFNLFNFEWMVYYLLLCAGDAILLYSLYTFETSYWDYKINELKFITTYRGKVIRVEP